MGGLKSFFRRDGRGSGLSRLLSPATSAPASSTSQDGAVIVHRPAGASSSATELVRVFHKFDANGDGKISEEELAAVFTSLGSRPTGDELRRMMVEADSDGDGYISLEEFVELNTHFLGPDDEDLREAFAVFDVDRDGRISAEELARVLAGIGERATVAQCKKMIRGVDLNGDGLVSFDEFRVMMASGSGFGASFGPIPKNA